MKKMNILAAIACTGLLFCSGCGGGSSSKETSTQKSETSSSAQVLESTVISAVDGQQIKVDRIQNGLIFRGHENKIVLLEVYGASCPHCIAAIPGYNRLQSKYQNDVKVITIESYGQLNSEGLRNYAAEHNMQYTTVAREASGKMISFVQSLTGYTPESAGVPVLLVFSRDGKLAEYYPPQDLPEQKVDNLIQGLL